MPKPQRHSNSTAARPLNIPWSKSHTSTCAALLIFVSRLVEAATVYAWLTLHLVTLRCTKAVGTEGAVVVRGLRAQWDHWYVSSLASKTLTWHLPSSHVCGKRSSIRFMLPNLLTFGWKVWLPRCASFRVKQKPRSVSFGRSEVVQALAVVPKGITINMP
jgi:hypothetical protein